MKFDQYSARMRAQLPPADPAAADELLLDHFERKAVVDSAISDVDRLSRVIEQDRRGLEREVVRIRLHQLADVAQAAGVRVSIEHHSLPEIPPRG